MKGICFIEPLFHKVVKGEKTQTRRMIKPQPEYSDRVGIIYKGLCYGIGFDNPKAAYYNFSNNSNAARYQVGEKVYLKEPYAETCDEYGSPLIAYRFDNTALYLVRKDENGDYCQLNTIKKPVTTNWTINNFPACGEWKNKLFMPESVARYFIEITAVRAERLQDISEEDCMKEGIEYVLEAMPIGYPFGVQFPFKNGFHSYTTAKEAYAALIDKINGKGTWEKNPFVWVYEFRLIHG